MARYCRLDASTSASQSSTCPGAPITVTVTVPPGRTVAGATVTSSELTGIHRAIGGTAP